MNDENVIKKVFEPLIGKASEPLSSMVHRMTDKILERYFDCSKEQCEVFHEICRVADENMYNGVWNAKQSVDYQLKQSIEHGIVKDEQDFIRLWSMVSGTRVVTLDEIVVMEEQNIEFMNETKRLRK